MCIRDRNAFEMSASPQKFSVYRSYLPPVGARVTVAASQQTAAQPAP